MVQQIVSGYRAGKRAALEASVRFGEQTEGADPSQTTYLVGPDGTRRWDATTRQWVVVPQPRWRRRGCGGRRS